MRVLIAEEKDIDRAVDLAMSLQDNPETRCRPLGQKASRQELYDYYLTYVRGDSDNLLLVEDEGRLVGCTGMYWMEADKYVTYIQGPYGYDYQGVSTCLYNYILDHFKGYSFYVNTAREHKQSIAFFESKGFNQIEDAVLMTLENYRGDYWHQAVEGINDTNKEVLFQWIDRHVDEDTYWNSDRISQRLDYFIILGYFDQGLKGHIIGRGSSDYTEVIGFTGSDHVKEELFKTFLTEAGRKNVNSIDLYTEEADEVALGHKYKFDLTDNNQCFLKHL